MGTTEIIGWIVSALLGIVMMLVKMQNDSIQRRIEILEDQIVEVKEEYFRKEDFREFKQELWARLDKMETSFESRLDKAIKSYAIKDFPDIPRT
jgi:hypothetical protein